MRMFLALVVALSPALASAEPPPYFDFARGLRAQGLADLAVEYLEGLKAKPPAGLASLAIELEIAKARLEIAIGEGDDAKKKTAYTQAKADFDALLAKVTKANKDDPLIPQLQVELARLIAAQGRDKLTQADRTENAAAKQAELVLARPQFASAAALLQQAVKKLDEQIKKAGDNKALANDLALARGRAALDEGILYVEQSKTFDTGKEGDVAAIKASGDALAKARTILEPLGKGNSADPNTYLARAWTARAWIYDSDNAKANQIIDGLLKETNPVADSGKRLAGYFKLLQESKTVGAPVATPAMGADRAKFVKSVRDWQTRYRNSANTPEGQAVKYLLANALRDAYVVEVTPKTRKVTGLTANAKEALVMAERLYAELADSEGPYADRATTNRIIINRKLIFAENDGEIDPAKLVGFEKCYQAAQIEASELHDLLKRSSSLKANLDATKLEVDAAEAADKPAKQKAYTTTKQAFDANAKGQKRAIGRTLILLGKALEAATARDAKRALEARVMMTYIHLVGENPYAAAVTGESVARANPGNPKAVKAALYALDGYNRVIDEQKKRGDDEEERKGDEARLRKLASYMDKTWPTAPDTDFARHQLGTFLAQQEQLAEACELLSKVSLNYPRLYAARLDQALAASRLQRKAGGDAAAREKIVNRVLLDLETLPPVGPESDADDAKLYFNARIRQGLLLYFQAKHFDALQKLGEKLTADLAAQKRLDPSDKDELTAATRALKFYGLWGQGRQRVQVSQFDDALKFLDASVKEIRADLAKPPAAESPSRGMLTEAQRLNLLLVLGANVQTGKIAEATDLLGVLQKAGGSDSTKPLLDIIRQIQARLLKLRKDGQLDAAKATEQSFAQFLDAVAAAPKMSNDARSTIARGFSSVGQHNKAVAQLQQIPPPKEGKPLDNREFSSAQFLMGQELRLDKQFPQAKAHFEKMQKDGYKPIDLRMELVMLEEDQNHFQDATQQWKALQAPFAKTFKVKPANAQEQNFNNLYYEIEFYKLRCRYKWLQTAKNPANKQQGLVDLGKALATLDGKEMGPRNPAKFTELIESDPVLRQNYTAAGGKQFLAGG